MSNAGTAHRARNEQPGRRWARAHANRVCGAHAAVHEPRAVAYADSGLALSKKQSEDSPDNNQARMLYAVMLAYGGRAADATREIEEGMARVARANRNDDESNYARLLSARGYVAREQYDKAVDALERLVRVPDFITPGWLKVDPTFKPLRGNARFERLLQAPRA